MPILTRLRRLRAGLGREQAGEAVERFLADAARMLCDAGFRRFIVCRGETSGAVVAALGIQSLRIGPEIDLGAPWTRTVGAQPLLLALKSGNLGAPDFFSEKIGNSKVSESYPRPRGIVIGSPKLAVQSFSRGLTTGATRNISVRLSDGGLLITPTNASLGALEPDDLSHFSDGGQQIDGRKSWKEAFLHECMYCARLVAGAVVHPHSTHSAALSILDDVDPSYVLPPLTAYYVMRVGRMPLVPYYPPGHRDWPRRSRGWRHPITRCYCRTMGRW